MTGDPAIPVCRTCGHAPADHAVHGGPVAFARPPGRCRICACRAFVDRPRPPILPVPVRPVRVPPPPSRTVLTREQRAWLKARGWTPANHS